jgi:hypothetical protein
VTTVGRWTALLMLAAVFAMHGLPSVSALPGRASAAAPVAVSVPAPMTTLVTAADGAHAHAADSPVIGSGNSGVLEPAAGVERHGPAPHDSAGHLWTLCLAVLAAALAAVLATLLPGPVRLNGSSLERARRRAPRWLVPPRPPDLSSLGLLRI